MSPPCSAEAAGGLHPPYPDSLCPRPLHPESCLWQPETGPRVARTCGLWWPFCEQAGWRPGAQSLSFLPEHWSPSWVPPPCLLVPSQHQPSGSAGAQASAVRVCGSGCTLLNKLPQIHLSSVCSCLCGGGVYLCLSVCVYLHRQIFSTACRPSTCRIRYRALAGAAPYPALHCQRGRNAWGPCSDLHTGVCGELRVPSLCPPWGPPLSEASFHLFQGIVWPQVFSGVVGNCVNGLANYVLVSVLGQGVR